MNAIPQWQLTPIKSIQPCFSAMNCSVDAGIDHVKYWTTVCLHWVGTDQLFQRWYIRNVRPTHDRMRRSCALPFLLRWNTSLIMCSNVATKLWLWAMRRGPIVSRHEIMWQPQWTLFMHSQHSCGARRCVRRTLANLVTRGLQPDFPNSLLVLVEQLIFQVW